MNVFRGNVVVRGIGWLCLSVLTLMISVGCANAQGLELPDDPLAEPDRWLSEERWSELRYGLSIREPHKAKRVPDTAQGDVMRWALLNGTRISMSFARGVYEGVSYNDKTKQYKPVRTPARVDLLKRQINDELKTTSGKVINTRIDQVIEVDRTAGIINYYVIKPHERVGKPYFYGVALLQLDDFSAVILKLECHPDLITEAASTFECMVHSIKIEEAKEVNRRLHNWLQNSEELLKDFTQEDRVSVMRSDRLYRVIENNRDIGFTRVWQRYQDKDYYRDLKAKRGEEAGPLQGIDRFEAEGNAIFAQTRLEGRGAVIQRLEQAIDVPGEPTAYWQTKNALNYKNDPNNLFAGTWVETGVRSIATIGDKRMDYIQLTREGTPPKHMVDFILERENDPERRLRYSSVVKGTLPTGEVVHKLPSGEVVEKAWPTPKRAFLSPVDATLMPAMLPNEAMTYAFSAYHRESSSIDFRLMRVEPNADGGKTVYLRPVLDLSEQVLVFDANNELVSHTYPDGRSLKKTTRQELAQIWGVRLRE